MLKLNSVNKKIINASYFSIYDQFGQNTTS